MALALRFAHFHSCTFCHSHLFPSPLLSVLPPPPSCFPHTLCMCLCHVVNQPSFWPPVQHVRYIEKKTLLCSNWVGLGILSSVGLGTDTFLLYLVRTFFSCVSMTSCLPCFAVQTFTCRSMFMTVLKPSGWWWWCRDAGLKSLCLCCCWVVAKALIRAPLKAFGGSLGICTCIRELLWVCAFQRAGGRWIDTVVGTLFWQAV